MFDPEELKRLKADQQTSRIKPTVEPDRPQPDRPSNPQSQITHSGQPQTELYNPSSEANFGLATLIAPLGALFNNLTRAITITARELLSPNSGANCC